MTLTEFLLARIAEDKAGWPEDDSGMHHDAFARCPLVYGQDGECTCGAVAAKRRALAECEAKRLRIQWLMSLHHDMGAEDSITYESCRILAKPGELGDLEVGYCSCGLDARRNRLYKFDALVWSDHPDYQAEWAL